MQSDNVELISNQADLNKIIQKFNKNIQFAIEFKFAKRDYFYSLLQSLNIEPAEFEKKYFFFDVNRQLHISESEFGNVWISTMGLVAKNKVTTNKAVNACVNQHTVISLILDRSIKIIQCNDVYDIDSYNSEELSKLSPALFHNSLFYIEVFCKAYLSLCGIKTPFTHKLTILYAEVVATMYAQKHNNSLFQVTIMDKLSPLVKHINKIPGEFKEQFVKYDDNPDDATVILFRLELLEDLKSTFMLCVDFITDFYHDGIKSHYLRQGFYQKLLDKAENEAEKKKVINMYDYLINPSVGNF